MKFTVHTQQVASIVREFEIEANSESDAKEKIEIMIRNGDLPDPTYLGTEVCGKPEVFDVSEI